LLPILPPNRCPSIISNIAHQQSKYYQALAYG